MISRIVDCNIRNDKLHDFTATLDNKFLPRLKSQPGFVDVIESLDPQSGHFLCMTLWRSQDDVDRYDKGLFQEVAKHLTPLLTEPPKVETMNVENSSIHRIEHGRAQAA